MPKAKLNHQSEKGPQPIVMLFAATGEILDGREHVSPQFAWRSRRPRVAKAL